MTGAHVEVTSRLPIPPLMTRCNKITQAYSSHLELGKRLLEQPPFLPNKKLAIQPKTPTQPNHTIVLFVPDHHPMLKSEVLTVQAFRQHFHDLDALCNVLCPSGESGKLRSLPFIFAVEPFKSEDLVLHKMAERGHGAYIRGIWTECMKPDLYRKATVAWSYGGSLDLEQWVTLGHTALQLLYSAPFPDPVFGVPEKCPICLEPMHFPLTTECGHTFHKACLEWTQSPTCPLCRQTV
ncbi:hypothetical protein TNCT_244661 [Trichonephila clavata]|uniref:RING-type domain-containing protein n=1 Tax=Trichonephila clavata TaxID=2740835 RepID=A0A8X6IRJ8_TRICU|nr:hypothetical protein TNCT_244661 [Trichonephila clavata]